MEPLGVGTTTGDLVTVWASHWHAKQDVDEPQMYLQLDVCESHTLKLDVYDPHTLNVNVSEPHTCNFEREWDSRTHITWASQPKCDEPQLET